MTFILNPQHAHQQGRSNWSKPYVHMSAAGVKLPTAPFSFPCAMHMPIGGGKIACWRQQRNAGCVKTTHQLGSISFVVMIELSGKEFTSLRLKKYVGSQSNPCLERVITFWATAQDSSDPR